MQDRTEDNNYRGPQDLDEETFNRECLRCGRTLNTDGTTALLKTGSDS